MEQIDSSRLDDALKRAYAGWGEGPLTKQLLLRRALTLLGAGFVASNTTAARRALGAAIKRCWPSGGPAFVTATSPCHTPAVCAVHDAAGTEESVPRQISDSERDTAKQELEQRGVAVLPRMLGPGAVAAVARSVNAAAPAGTTLLRPSTGNGEHGRYSYFEPPADSPLWPLRDALSDRFQMPQEASRLIVLAYGESGANYSHRDQSEFPLQATLLLSRPGVDFSGGDFVVTTGDQEHVAACDHAGDVVVFNAHAPFSHGIRTVHAGSSASEAQRFAIGLFFPGTSSRRPRDDAVGRGSSKRPRSA